MKRLAFSVPLVLLLAAPALADKGAKTYRVEVPTQVRTEIYLERSKARAAAGADRLTGANTFTTARERRLMSEPRRYLPRYVEVKVWEKK